MTGGLVALKTNEDSEQKVIGSCPDVSDVEFPTLWLSICLSFSHPSVYNGQWSNIKDEQFKKTKNRGCKRSLHEE